MLVGVWDIFALSSSSNLMGESLSWFFFAILILIGKVFNAGAFTSASTRPLFRKQTWSFKASKNLEVVGDDLNPHDATFVRRLHYVPTSSDKEDLPTVIPEVSNELNADQFATVFTQYAPYIAMHRGSKVVIHLASHLFQHRHVFDAIMDDISILHLLGVQLVLVAGVRDQLDFKLKSEGTIPVISDGGMRVTDDQTMRLLKEVSGSARFEIESALSRGFRGHADNSGINVVSGNFFYSAKPLGVRAGVDFKYTGEVRRIETDNLKKRLDAGDVVLLTSLGHSNSGEVFNVPSESLAAECAAKLQAAKIIFFTAGDCIMNGQTGEVVQSLRLPQVQRQHIPSQYCYDVIIVPIIITIIIVNVVVVDARPRRSWMPGGFRVACTTTSTHRPAMKRAIRGMELESNLLTAMVALMTPKLTSNSLVPLMRREQAPLLSPPQHYLDTRSS